MRLLRDVRLPPLAWVAIAAGVTAVVRFAVALQVRTPLYYPDEYRATALARSISDGGLPRIRGESIGANFTSYVPTLLQAPAWLIEDVDVAYRTVQALGCLAFAASAFPAYVIARRLGLSGGGGVLVAVLALLVPSGAFTATVLAEPYGYTAFLLAVLLGVHTLTRPTAAGHLVTLAVAVCLCLVGGLQFVFFGLAYVAAWVVADWSPRRVLQRLIVAFGGAVAGAFVLATAAQGRLLDTLTEVAGYFDYSVGGIAVWFVVNVFILAVSCGWVHVPAAVLGLKALVRSVEPTHRAFAVFAVMLLLAMTAEAAVMSQAYGLHERFTFYGAALLAVGFVWAWQHALPSRTAFAVLAYAGALAAVILPITSPLRGANDDHTPTLMGLAQLDVGDGASGLVWAPILVLLAFGTAAWGFRRHRLVAGAAAAVCAVLSACTSLAFVRLAEEGGGPHLDLPAGATYVAWAGGDRFLLQKTLFWNPEIERVAMLGDGTPDEYAFVRTEVDPRVGLVDATGERLPGPYVVGPDTIAVGDGAEKGPDGSLLRVEPPSLLAFGWYPEIGFIGSSGVLVGAAGDDAAQAQIRLRSTRGDKTIRFRCTSGFDRTVEVGPRPETITIPMPPGPALSCWFRLVRGGVETVDEREVSVRAELDFSR